MTKQGTSSLAYPIPDEAKNATITEINAKYFESLKKNK